MIKALFIRRFWLIRHRLLSTLGFMTLLPLFLHIAITMVMKNIFIRDDNNIFYDNAFRLIFTQQIFESLNVHGGFYLDRDKKSDKNTRHDLPIFGLSFQF